MVPPEGRYFQPHTGTAGQGEMQEFKLLNEVEPKNLQAIKQKLLDPLSNHLLLILFLTIISRVHFRGFHARASYCNSHW